MILVDTSVWIRHLREGDRQLSLPLEEGEVAARPWVIGELACGRFEPRDDILALLHALPRKETLTDDEFFRFLDAHHLVGCDLGFVDVHLLGAARLERIPLWTHDLFLCRAADGMELGYLP